jgi:exosortase A-associated hydrolase 1
MDCHMRRLLSFTCEGTALAATLDQASGAAGLLIVSGGNEIRIGAHRGMAKLARDVAAAGYPVLRFDRRGIGDSDGDNGGFEGSRADIMAATKAFRVASPSLTSITAFGNCDAATALLLHQPLATDALILANPWLIEATAAAPAPATARAYYAQRLRDPRAWTGLLGGAVNLKKLFGSLQSAAKRDQPSQLAQRVADQLALIPVDTRILLASGDGTAIAFKALWDGALFEPYRAHIPIISFDSPSHSFASERDYAILTSTIINALAQR